MPSIFSFLLALGLFLLSSCGSHDAEALSSEEEEIYLKKGKEIAQASFAALSSRLKAAMQEGGVPDAIDYCSLQAYPLTDSLSQAYEAEIRRLALRNRNPENEPDREARNIFESFQLEKHEGKKPEARLLALEGEKVAFYAPIFLKPLCLNCHGTPGENMLEETHKLILKKYPEDRAIDFEPGDLRGMWSITMKRQPREDKP